MRCFLCYLKKGMALLLTVCLSQVFALPALSEDAPGEGAMDGMVRVWLSSLGNISRVDVTVCGSYSLDGTAATALKENSTATVRLNASTGQLTLTREGVSTAMGGDFRLRRHSREGSNGVKISQARVSGNLYPGDIQFKAVRSGGSYRLYVIAHVFIEDYLYGVLPYEMGNSSALEALKAQCVCARTYTVRSMMNGKSRSYDLVDTTNDQVYNGTPAGNSRCRQAVEETRGIVALNSGAFTATYYTASNGGQIESVRNLWGYTGYDYIRVKDDPYDYQNPYSQVRSFRVAASGSQNAALASLLVSKAKSVFGASSVTIEKVTAVTPHTPRYAEPSRLYTKLNFDVEALCDGVRRTGTLTFDIFSELEKRLGMSINNSNNELWSVVSTASGFTVQARRFGHGTGMSQRGAMRMGDLGYTYDQILEFYFEGCQRAQYAFVRSVLSPLGSGLAREELSVDQPADIHGSSGAVGIVHLYAADAQMALRQAASPMGTVIAGIPHGAAVTVHARMGDWYLISYGQLTGYAQGDGLTVRGAPDGRAPAVSGVSAYGTVQGSAYLNLRQSASLTSAALVQVPAGTVLPILSREEGWAYTQYGCQAGYVSLDYLALSSAYSGNAMDANATGAETNEEAALYLSPSLSGYLWRTLPRGAMVQVLFTDGIWSRVNADGVIGYVLSARLTMNGTVQRFPADAPGEGEQRALVTCPGTVLNLHREPSMDSEVLLQIPRNEAVIVASAGTDWHQVRYHGVTGYCAAGYLTLGISAVQEGAELRAEVVTESGPLNLRKSASLQAAVLTAIPRGASVAVVARGESWCAVRYNGQTGYVLTKYLRLGEETAPAATAAPQPAATEKPAENGLVWTPEPVQVTVTYAKVTTASGSLNLRKKASSSASVQARIPQGEMIEVLSRGEKWTKVAYHGKSGYTMTAFLTFVEVPQPVVTDAMTARVATPSGSLNLRAKAASGSKVLRTIPRDAAVTVLEYGQKWSRVTYGTATGYVRSQFLAFEQLVSQVMRVAASGAALRADASASSAILAEIPKGDHVLVVSGVGGWRRAEYDGISGYLPTDILETP